jgi:hypothetical protein
MTEPLRHGDRLTEFCLGHPALGDPLLRQPALGQPVLPHYRQR